MENASKALIIAGAILLSILIIGMGMFIYNQAQDQIQKSAGQMSTEEINVHNSQFSSYVGNRQSGSQVKQLLNKLAINAGKYGEDDKENPRKPKIELKGIQNAGKLSGESNGYTANDVNTASRAILAASTYKVETDVDSTGLINKVTIERVTGSGSSSSSSTQKP